MEPTQFGCGAWNGTHLSGPGWWLVRALRGCDGGCSVASQEDIKRPLDPSGFRGSGSFQPLPHSLPLCHSPNETKRKLRSPSRQWSVGVLFSPVFVRAFRIDVTLRFRLARRPALVPSGGIHSRPRGIVLQPDHGPIQQPVYSAPFSSRGFVRRSHPFQLPRALIRRPVSWRVFTYASACCGKIGQ